MAEGSFTSQGAVCADGLWAWMGAVRSSSEEAALIQHG